MRFVRRTIEIEDDLDYLIKAYKAKQFLETGKEHGYNAILNTMLAYGFSEILNITNEEFEKYKKTNEFLGLLKKRMIDTELSKALEKFIKMQK